jgi:hypothetical protein
MKMVFYVKIFLDTPYFGTKGEEVYKYEADTPEELKKIIEIDYENAVRQHAEQYEHNVYGWDDVPTSDEALEELLASYGSIENIKNQIHNSHK